MLFKVRFCGLLADVAIAARIDESEVSKNPA
jgi:hypothetical protein